jgi:hypothetical protein
LWQALIKSNLNQAISVYQNIYSPTINKVLHNRSNLANNLSSGDSGKSCKEKLDDIEEDNDKKDKKVR